MSHTPEIVTNALNLGLSLAILALLVLLVLLFRRHGQTVLVARLYLKQRESRRAVALVLVGLVIFLVSNMLELYGDVREIDWVVNEVVETFALLVLLAGVWSFLATLRLPQRSVPTVRVERAGES